MAHSESDPLPMRTSIMDDPQGVKHIKTDATNLEAGCLWWEYGSASDRSNLDTWHRAADIKVFAHRARRLHHRHAVGAADILCWVLENKINVC